MNKDNSISIKVCAADGFLNMEWYTPTLYLRWIKKEVPFDNSTAIITQILQQMWQGNLGNIEWRDIELIENPE